jgi:hypothetical protein
MVTFQNGAAAKEYFVAQILQEASRQGTPLTEIEREMLYFTETAPDAKPEFVEKAAEFDRQYDQGDYEEKICGLLRGTWEHADTEVRDNLRAAYDILRKEDHYILVMLREALGGKLRKKWLGMF